MENNAAQFLTVLYYNVGVCGRYAGDAFRVELLTGCNSL